MFICESAPNALVSRMANTGTPRAFVHPRKRGALPLFAMYSTVREPR